MLLCYVYMYCNDRWTVTNGKKCQTLTAMKFSPASHQHGAQRLLACTAHDGGLRVIDYNKQELVVSICIHAHACLHSFIFKNIIYIHIRLSCFATCCY
jgi:hypothetical protein